MNRIERPVPTSKSEYVAQRLLDRIIHGNLKAGSALGTEAELLQQFDVSRPTLRESLRILEAQGVIELKPGPKGGILVSKPGMDVLAHGLSVYLRLHGVPFVAVLQAREAIEPALAAAVAADHTEADLAELQASVDRMRGMTDQAAFIEENRRFHSIVAEASRNEVMKIFWITISMLAAGELDGISYNRGNQRHVIEAHQGIVDAIRAGDARLAAERMGAHLGALEQLMEKRYRSLLTQTTSIVDRQGRPLG